MGDEQTLGALVSSASRDMSTLIRAEIELAKTELRNDAKAAAVGGGALGAAGFLGVVAFVLLSIAAALGLVTLGLNAALSFLIVAVVYLLVAGLLALVARGSMKRLKPPERTVRTAKETIAYLKRHPRSTP